MFPFPKVHWAWIPFQVAFVFLLENCWFYFYWFFFLMQIHCLSNKVVGWAWVEGDGIRHRGVVKQYIYLHKVIKGNKCFATTEALSSLSLSLSFFVYVYVHSILVAFLQGHWTTGRRKPSLKLFSAATSHIVTLLFHHTTTINHILTMTAITTVIIRLMQALLTTGNVHFLFLLRFTLLQARTWICTQFGRRVAGCSLLQNRFLCLIWSYDIFSFSIVWSFLPNSRGVCMYVRSWALQN